MDINKENLKIIDISDELFSAPLYPGGIVPQRTAAESIENGAFYNETVINLSVHTGTHSDACRHFFKDGISIDEMPLEDYIGPCQVVETNDTQITRDFLEKVISVGCKRLLIKGNRKAFFTPDGAEVLKEKGIITVGTDACTVAPFDDPKSVHLIILGAKIAILEGLDLSQVKPGEYFLIALPLKIAECDASPIRAVLIF